MPQADPLPPLTLACRGLGLLALEGLSVGLFFAAVVWRGQLLAYVTRNELSADGRAGLPVCMIGTAALFCGAGLLYLRRRRGQGPRILHEWALRLSPLILLGFVPLLLHRWLWRGRDLTFLAMVSLFGLGAQALARVALSQPEAAAGSWQVRLRTTCARLRERIPIAGLLPAVLVGAGAVGYAVFFAVHTVAYHWSVQSTSFDLGLENNLLWNLVHAGPFFKSSPALGPTGSHLGRHATFFAYVIAPVYLLAQRPETLLILQAVLMGGAAVPLFLFARRHVGAPAACLVALLYLLYPPLHGANLYDFHYLSLAPFFLWTSLCLLEARRDRLAALAVLVTLSVREDVAVGLVVVGAYLLLSGERPRAGAVVTLVAGAYFALMKFAVMPLAGEGETFLYLYKDLVPVGDSSFGGVLKTVFGNPAYTLTTLLERDKLVYLLQILAPLAFLPLRRPLGLLFLAPGFFFTLLGTGYAPLIQISFQYTAHWTAFVFVAAVINLAWVSRPAFPEDLGGRARRRAWLAAMVAAMLVSSYQYGAILQQQTVRGGFRLYKFGTTPADRERHNALYGLLAMVPPDTKIVGSEKLVPHVSSRPDAYTLRVGIFDAEYAIFPLDRAELLDPVEVVPLVQVLRTGEFGVVATRPPYGLARRGQPATGNAAVLARLGSPPP